MINIGRKDVSQVTAWDKTVTKIYAGGKLVWEAIRSCFGSGAWLKERPWTNDNAWKN